MITLTENAVAKVKDMMKEQELHDHGIRFFISQGGCSDTGTAYQYGMSLEPEPQAGDEVLEQHGLKVFVDKDSITFLEGMEIDYQDAHLGMGFVMRNPNAVHTCGCGKTFTPKEETAD
ncbi:iron-sulfur cluster assembly accessory protein [candidate division TA06 bacterium]|nr:iron-sulfur cluster assembly accessory protein [candidate division TA06 bacterium]